MRRRVFGIETEYGLMAASNHTQASVMDSEEAAKYLFASLTQQGRTTNLFLRNGGRLYVDVGSHPEYATAECDTIDDLLIQIRAGEELLTQLAERAKPHLNKAGFEANLFLFANNVDSARNSYGCHENYLLHRRRDFREVADALVTFFVTRIILTGAGNIQMDSPQAHYVFSQRADHMWEAVSSATTRSRPIINTRDEPLADTTLYRRMHVIVGDTNIAEPTTALKVGSTELLLTAIEDGLHISDLALADPMLAIRSINSDLTGSVELELANGRQMSAVEIQYTVLERVRDRLDVASLSDMHLYVLDLWERGINAIASGQWETVETELDIAIKHRLLTSYCARSGVSLTDPRVARLMLAYHQINGGLREQMEKGGLMKRLTNARQVQAGTVLPPRTTRARARGEVIAAAQDARVDLFADWTTLRLENDTFPAINLQDPLQADYPEIDSLMERIFQQTPVLPA